MTAAVTVVELKSFAAAAKGLISASEVAELTVFLAMTPKAGDLIAGTGGVRKLRWKASGRGKRGGARVSLLLSQRDGANFSDNRLCQER